MTTAFEPKFQSLVEIYQHSVRSFAERSLFGTRAGQTWQWMSYGEFGQRVDTVRAALEGLGVGPGDRVAIIANNRVEWAIAAYAAYTRGAAFVPMYEAQLDRDWQHILSDCGAKALFCADEAIRDRIRGFRGQLPKLEQIVVLDGRGDPLSLSFAELLDRGRGKSAPVIDPGPDAIAGLIYTSGTTGVPKGVLLSHRNLAYNVSAIHAIFPLTPDDRSLSFLPWAHSFGQVVELHGLFSMGASMGIVESVPKLLDNLAEIRPTLLISVPRIFNRIYDGIQKKLAHDGAITRGLFAAALANERARRQLAERGQASGWVDLKHRLYDRLVFSKVRARFGGRLKYAFSGGAAISRAVAEFIDQLGITVYEGYGLTETSPIATANYPGNRKLGTVGKAIPGVRVDIDAAGEVIVHGHNVMKGYNNLPQEDAAVFTADGGFRTGDLGHLDDEGYLTITGRLKEQYKLENGKYVAPAPLEEQLKLSTFITGAMVYGDNRPYNVALIVPDWESLNAWAREQGLDPSPDALLADPRVQELFTREIALVSADFRAFEQVRRFALIPDDFTPENDMLTPSMKLKRRVVLERYRPLIEGLYT